MSGQEEKKYSQKEVDAIIDQKLREKAKELAKEGVAAWISKEKAGGQSNADSGKTDRQKAEEAIKKQSTIEAIKANTAIAQIKSEPARKLVEDSYDTWFANAGIYNFSQAVHSRFMGYAFLSYLSQDAMINNGVTVMSDELTRKWGEVINPTNEADDANIGILNDLISELNTKHRFREAAISTGFFGGCLIYIDIRDENGVQPDDAELATPLYIEGKDELNASKLKNKKIVGLKVIEPINISPSEYNSTDPKAQDFYQPQHFYVLGQKIHRSRFLYFADILPPMILKPVYMFFGIPLAQLAFEYVQDFYTNKQAISKIIKKFSLTAFKTDTQKLLQGENGACGVEDRVATLAKYRDNDSVLILDINEEELEQINTPLTGLKEIWYANLELIPMIFKTPAPKLLQIAPSSGGGLNSTGEFEMRSFYDSVNTKQNTLFGEPMQRLINILCFTQEIDPKGYAFDWTPLYEMSEKEIAELNKAKAETDNILYQAGAITNQDIAKRLSEDEKSGHNGIEIPELIDPNAFENEVENADGNEEDGGEGYFSDADFVEEDHPREEDGKFAPKGGGGSSGGQSSEGGSGSPDSSSISSSESVPDKIYLNVPYSEKDEAKSLGAKWDGENKKWYVPKGVSADSFGKWERATINQNFGARKMETVPTETIIKDYGNGIQAVKETNKALLLKKEGINFWIQKRWIREDGSLTKAGENSFNETRNAFKTKENRNKVLNEHIETLKKEGVSFAKSWESDDAVGVDIYFSIPEKDKTVKNRVFIPKSILLENGRAPYFYVEAKIKELYRAAAYYGGISDVGGKFLNYWLKESNDKITKDENNNEMLLTLHNGKFYEIKEKI